MASASVQVPAMRRRTTLGMVVLLGLVACLCMPALVFVQPPRASGIARQVELRQESMRTESVPLEIAAPAAALLAAAPAAHAEMGMGEMAVLGPLGILNTGLNLFKLMLGIYAIMSWLFAFGILDIRQEFVQTIQGTLSSVIDPVLAPLRSLIPPLLGFDLSFMALFFIVDQAQVASKVIMIGALDYV
mmetsp:Transcript_8248/g.19400  ORF Transcript_8248/g.19400 Transcript_8248/m.19400 type:complete len:188 (-) Transcript_8248:103-666(-)